MPARQLRWTTGDRTAVSAKLLFSCTAFTHVWRKVGNQILFEYVIDDDYVGCKHFSVIGADKIEWYRVFFFSSPHLGGEVSTVRDHKLFLFMTSVTKILPLLSLGPSPSPQSSSLSSVSIVVTHKKAIIIMKKNSSESHKEEGKREGGRRETRFHA